MTKTALICGVSGQDGSLLARLLLGKGYRVIGTSRDAQASSFSNLARVGALDNVETCSMSLTDFRSTYAVLNKYAPDEIYNLAGQTSVGLSFEQPVEALESIGAGTLNLLEVLRLSESKARLYNAGSSECFGDTGQSAANEQTPFRPQSPYAVAKSTAFWQVANYRQAYDLFACSGILFNHESPLRPARFVTRKIVRAAMDIANGSGQTLRLGNLDVKRDWGWAPEFVEAMWLMLQQDQADDFVVATGHTISLKDFVTAVFAEHGLNWEEHVEIDPQFFRTTDIDVSRADPGKAADVLGWSANMKMPAIAAALVAAESQHSENSQGAERWLSDGVDNA